MDTLAELVTLRSFKVHANCRWVGQIVNSGLKHPVKTYCRAKVHVGLPVTLFVLLIVLFMNCECYCLQVYKFWDFFHLLKIK